MAGKWRRSPESSALLLDRRARAKSRVQDGPRCGAFSTNELPGWSRFMPKTSKQPRAAGAEAGTARRRRRAPTRAACWRSSSIRSRATPKNVETLAALERSTTRQAHAAPIPSRKRSTTFGKRGRSSERRASCGCRANRFPLTRGRSMPRASCIARFRSCANCLRNICGNSCPMSMRCRGWSS